MIAREMLAAEIEKLVHDPAALRRLWQALGLEARRDGQEVKPGKVKVKGKKR